MDIQLNNAEVRQPEPPQHHEGDGGQGSELQQQFPDQGVPMFEKEIVMRTLPVIIRQIDDMCQKI